MEYSRWLFVDFVPLLYDRKRVSKQFQIEMWLDPSPILQRLDLRSEHTKASRRSTSPETKYIV